MMERRTRGLADSRAGASTIGGVTWARGLEMNDGGGVLFGL